MVFSSNNLLFVLRRFSQPTVCKMPLSTATCDVLKICKPLLEENRSQIGVTFYKKLFQENPGLKNVFNMSHQRLNNGQPSAQQLSLADSLISYCANCDQLENLGPFVNRVAHKHVSFDIQPEQYPVVGGVLLATLEEVLGKETFNGDVKSAVAEAYFFLADIFINKETDIKKSFASQPGGWNGWRKLKLVEKIQESPIHTSFLLAPADGGSLMKYEPGQFLSIKLLEVPGSSHAQCRNYSLSDEPRTDVYRITVKKEKDGLVSSYLHDTFSVGDVLDAGVPCGHFTLQSGSSVFLAAGVGITPLLSMMKVSANAGFKDTLIYRASDSSSHPFRNEIETVMSKTGCAVHWMYSDNKDEKSKYNVENLDRMITNKSSKFYICGPSGFIDDTIKYLNDIGIDSKYVFYEHFGPSS